MMASYLKFPNFQYPVFNPTPVSQVVTFFMLSIPGPVHEVDFFHLFFTHAGQLGLFKRYILQQKTHADPRIASRQSYTATSEGCWRKLTTSLTLKNLHIGEMYTSKQVHRIRY